MKVQRNRAAKSRNRFSPIQAFVFFFSALCIISLAVIGSNAYPAQTTLVWKAPTANEDGTPITNLAGYRVHYGTASRSYAQKIDAGNVTTHTVTNLAEGTTYYFAVTAYNVSGQESKLSNEISRTIPKPIQQYLLTVSKAGTGSGMVTSSPAGISCGSDCTESYNSGASVTLTAAPNADSTFSGWEGACSGMGLCTVTMNASRTVAAVFAVKTYTMTAKASNGGIISPSGTSVVTHGASKTYSISANDGYLLSDVKIDGISAGAVASYTFTNITAPHTIEAVFESDPYALNVVDNGDPGTSYTGTWSISGGKHPYGADSLWSRNGTTYTWQINPPVPGIYEVMMWWSGWPSRAASVPVTVTYQGGTESITVNQQKDSGMWNSLGKYYFQGPGSVTVTAADGATVSTAADAVAFQFISDYAEEIVIDNRDSRTSMTGVWDVSGGASPYGNDSVWSRNGATFSWHFSPSYTGAYDVSMWWTAWSSRSASVPVDIEHAGGKTRVSVDQQKNGGVWNNLGTYYFNAGVRYKVTVLSQPYPTSTSADAVKVTLIP
ncbi:MAG: fibronectin type III domain-containing protein [Nitrospirota bacterium]